MKFDNSSIPVATVTVNNATKDKQLDGWNFKTITFEPSVTVSTIHVTIKGARDIGSSTSVAQFVIGSHPKKTSHRQHRRGEQRFRHRRDAERNG